jgi:hypothetical protein
MPASEAIQRAYAIPQEEEISKVPPNPQQEPCCDWQNSSANTSNWSDRKTEASRKQAAQRGAKNAFKQRGIGKDRHRHDRVAGSPGGPGDPLGSRKGQICLGGEQERSGASPRCRRRPRRCRRSSCGCSSRPPWTTRVREKNQQEHHARRRRLERSGAGQDGTRLPLPRAGPMARTIGSSALSPVAAGSRARTSPPAAACLLFRVRVSVPVSSPPSW